MVVHNRKERLDHADYLIIPTIYEMNTAYSIRLLVWQNFPFSTDETKLLYYRWKRVGFIVTFNLNVGVEVGVRICVCECMCVEWVNMCVYVR